jgi:hypothetical protein
MGEDADRIEATARMLEASAQEAHMFASGDGRVSEADAAVVRLCAKYLRQLRSEGKGPPAYSLGLNGCRVSYRFVDIAQWIEARRDFFDE